MRRKSTAWIIAFSGVTLVLLGGILGLLYIFGDSLGFFREPLDMDILPRELSASAKPEEPESSKAPESPTQEPAAASSSTTDTVGASLDSPDFPTNRWVKLSTHPAATLGWTRQEHSGMAYNSSKGTLLLFGSDTHGSNFDNSVHEYDPSKRTWTTHYEASPLSTYRTDAQGHAIAGDPGTSRPWAMHTYDEVVYDPQKQTLVVIAEDNHNYPAYKQVPGVKYYPTWVFSPSTRTWTTFLNTKATDIHSAPNFFASASAYDSYRNVIWGLKRDGLWYIDPARAAWNKVGFPPGSKMPPLEIHFNMVYDSIRHNLAIFGDHQPTNKVVVYTPGVIPQQPGRWEVRTPGGDVFPEDNQLPAAFDANQGVFLLLPGEGTSGEGGRPLATFIYSPVENTYLRISEAGSPGRASDLNYMLEYDPARKAFLFVNADSNKDGDMVAVWALKLDYSALQPGHTEK